MYIVVTPVKASPDVMAALIGAAPRNLGKSEAWTLMQPNLGALSRRGGDNLAEGHHHKQIGPPQFLQLLDRLRTSNQGRL